MKKLASLLLVLMLGLLIAMPAQAAPPDVKTVPAVPGDPLAPHDTWSGKQITLKGTADIQGAGIQFEWDFGDGSPPATGGVADQYVIEAVHTYVGSVGDVFVARLTVTNTGTAESGSATYFVVLKPRVLATEVNVAIDEGLWYLHKTQRRFSDGGVDLGDWTGGGLAASVYFSNSAANISAFEVNGHLESGDPDNPYVETVGRAMRELFRTHVRTQPIDLQTNGLGGFDPDTNGNGIGVGVNQSLAFYQGGMLIDAIVSSKTPDALVTYGPLAALTSPSTGGGYTYFDAVQDLVDYYSYCQYDGGGVGGGWRYNCNDFPDNSAAQWAAIGLIPAERDFGATVLQIVKDWNQVWINFSQHPAGYLGYTNFNPSGWGPYATTPSGMVQMAMDGFGRGDNRWDRAETYLRDRFCNGGGPTNAIRDYYYGLFSFTKSMLLHDSDNNGVPDPNPGLGIELMQSQTSGVAPLDWYNAEAAAGSPCDGVARTLVNDQNPAGFWTGHNFEFRQRSYETAQAIIMLRQTVTGLPPVAIAQAIPNPAIENLSVSLDGSTSRATAPGASIVNWEWDLGCDGSFELSGPVVDVISGFTLDTCVRLKVTDDQSPALTDEAQFTVFVVPPPVPPTADANGPYEFCPQTQPWFLDGTGSVNPDEGVSEGPGLPGNTLIEYAWDMDIDGQFDDAFGPQPDVTAYFTALGTGNYVLQLRVTDNSASSHPVLSGGMNLRDDSLPAPVLVRGDADPQCATCVNDLVATAGDGEIQLAWTDTGAVSFNVYRSTSMGGPYVLIANTTASTYLDTTVTNGVTYYYVVREVALNTDELCQSNEASATPQASQKCDMDGDGDIDRNDIMVIFGLRGTYSPPSDPNADLDDNGIININDARGCVLRCTLPRCAVQ